MPTKCNKKVEVEEDVRSLAIRRFHDLYDRMDKVWVSFSGGKDSTVVLNLALEVARERGKLPLDVVFFDEEAIPWDTIEYVQRVSELPDVNMKWLCLPLKDRNACSRSEPYWTAWDPDHEDLWCRPMPEQAIRTLPNWNGEVMSMPYYNGLVFGPEYGNVALAMGVRTQESMQRYMAIATNKVGFNCFCNPDRIGGSLSRHVTRAYPIYDWKTEDVWLAPHLEGWDYNTSYDRMDKAGIPLHNQRVAPPFGEQPVKRLHMFSELWPEFWNKMVLRVPGANTARLYGHTELYGTGTVVKKREEEAWRDVVMNSLGKMPADARRVAAKSLNLCIKEHNLYTDDNIPDDYPHPVSGFSWQEIAKAAVNGDLNGRREESKIRGKARSFRIKNGVSKDDRIRQFARK